MSLTHNSIIDISSDSYSCVLTAIAHRELGVMSRNWLGIIESAQPGRLGRICASRFPTPVSSPENRRFFLSMPWPTEFACFLFAESTQTPGCPDAGVIAQGPATDSPGRRAPGPRRSRRHVAPTRSATIYYTSIVVYYTSIVVYIVVYYTSTVVYNTKDVTCRHWVYTICVCVCVLLCTKM
jgi:hypothetical protein